MNTTRTGKIGRLRKSLRHELGLRIEDGQTGQDLVAWLNQLPDVQFVLNLKFEGRPITEQNLSDWRQTGHLDWLRRQEAREAIRQITDQATDVDEETGDHNLSDRLATVLASEMTRLAMALLEPETDPEKRWQRLCQIHREISQLRRDDHRAMRARVQRERWEQAAAREAAADRQRQAAEQKQKLTEMVMASMHNQAFAEAFGGGVYGKYMADLLHRIRFDLPMDDLHLPGAGTACPRKSDPQEKPAETPANSQKSSLIVPNRTKKTPTQTEATAGGDAPSPKPPPV